jgi:hypothetical protein
MHPHIYLILNKKYETQKMNAIDILRDKMNLQQVRFQNQFNANLAGQQISCSVSVRNSWEVSISFPYHNTNYDFAIATNNSLFIKFLRFYIQESNDNTYGTIDPTTDGVITTGPLRDQFSLALARYFMDCLNAIMTTQGRHILDYAVWFRERSEATNFSLLVHKTVCHFIVHEDFISGTANYEVTNWTI